jgi:hypothetical protein
MAQFRMILNYLGVGWGVGWVSAGVASVGISWQQCGNGHNSATID